MAGLIDYGLEQNRQALGLMGEVARQEADREGFNRRMRAESKRSKWNAAGQGLGLAYMAYNSGLLTPAAGGAEVAGAMGPSLTPGSGVGAAAITPGLSSVAAPAATAPGGVAGGMTGINASGSGLVLSPTASTAGSAAITPGLSSVAAPATTAAAAPVASTAAPAAASAAPVAATAAPATTTTAATAASSSGAWSWLSALFL